jgi:hypothetical protein
MMWLPPNTPPPSRGAIRPSCSKIIRPKNKRAQGMPGACCTRGLVCKTVQKNAHEHTGTVGAARHSPRNGFTAYAVISPETNSSCLRRRRIEGLSKPGRVRKTSVSLTPATGARTTRFCRTQQPDFASIAFVRNRTSAGQAGHWRRSSARCVRSRTKARPENTPTRPTLPRPPHPAPRS